VRDSFLMYTENLEVIEMLNDLQRSQLLLAIMRYQSGKEIGEIDPTAMVVFTMLRKQFDKDYEKYQETCERRRDAGLKGGRPKASATEEKAKKPNGFEEKAKKPNGFSENQSKAKKADNDNDNDNDNDINNNILSGKPTTLPIYHDIIDYLNSKIGTHYKSQNKKTQSLINARVSEGFTLDDFKTVIDKMVKEWRGTKMEQYLRPETLFGTKFESYLNATIRGNPQTRKPTPEWQRNDDFNAIAARLIACQDAVGG